MFYDTKEWNTFIASTMRFVAQLESLPDYLEKRMDTLLRKAAHGPVNWLMRGDVAHLRALFGFHSELKHVRTMVMATMIRAAWQENRH